MSDEPRKLKRRTREHIIADLGVNFVERQILLAGFTAERFQHDYGLDLTFKTFNPDGEVEPGQSKIQVKATDHLALSATGDTIGVRVAMADFRAWLMEWDPILLVIYDAQHTRAYWLDVQEHAGQHELDEDAGGQTITLRVPVNQEVTPEATQIWRARLEELRETM
jgi:hypothetical protein